MPRTAAKIGAVKPSAVTSAIGVIARPVKKANMAMQFITARTR